MYARARPDKGKMDKSTVIEVDTDKIKTVDISNGIDPETGKELKGKALGYAKKDKELLTKDIPADAYTICDI